MKNYTNELKINFVYLNLLFNFAPSIKQQN